MLPRSKTVVLLICLFLISFKVAAAGVFVQAALERAHQVSVCGQDSAAQQAGESKSATDDKHHPVSSLNLMSHITAIESSDSAPNFALTYKTIKFGVASNSLRPQNIPDSAFKPPKTSA
jgi:hypothetical protein